MNDADRKFGSHIVRNELYGEGPLYRALVSSVERGELEWTEAIAVARACHGVSRLGWRPPGDLYLGDAYAADLAFLVTTDEGHAAGGTIGS